MKTPSEEQEREKAKQHAIVMAYEAMRVCLGLPTKYHTPAEVIRWMQCIVGIT